MWRWILFTFTWNEKVFSHLSKFNLLVTKNFEGNESFELKISFFLTTENSQVWNNIQQYKCDVRFKKILSAIKLFLTQHSLICKPPYERNIKVSSTEKNK